MSKKDEKEGILEEDTEIQTRSSNGLNQLSLHIRSLDKATINLTKLGKILDLQDEKERAVILEDEAGWDLEEALSIIDVYNGRILVNRTIKDDRFNRVKSYLVAAFRDWCYENDLTNVKVIINNIELQENMRQASFGQIAGIFWAATALVIQKMKNDSSHSV